MTLDISTSIPALLGTSLTAKQPGEAASAYGETAQPITPVRKLSDVLEAEALLMDRQSRRSVSRDHPDPRYRRALEAYASLEQTQQRNYMSRVLGIDEYV